MLSQTYKRTNFSPASGTTAHGASLKGPHISQEDLWPIALPTNGLNREKNSMPPKYGKWWMTRKKLSYSDHVNSFPLKGGCLPKGWKVNHETTRVLEKDTLVDKKMVSPIISEKHQDILIVCYYFKLTFSISNQFCQSKYTRYGSL